MINKCCVCGVNIDFMDTGYYIDGKQAHIWCFEKEIAVYKIEAIGLGSYCFDVNPPSIEDLLDGGEYGDGYIITKETMKASKYYTLPEFMGF